MNCRHDTCHAIRDYLENCLSDVELGEEVRSDLSKSLSCIFVLEERMLVKRLVRRALERTPVPEHLAIEIAERIRNDGRMDAVTGDRWDAFDQNSFLVWGQLDNDGKIFAEKN